MPDWAVFQHLEQIVAAMRQQAEAGDWDRFIELQSECAQIMAALPALDSADWDAQARQVLPQKLRNIQDGLATILPLAEKHKASLAAELAGAHNAAKLNRTYQS